jgi:hypothetical protein
MKITAETQRTMSSAEEEERGNIKSYILDVLPAISAPLR